MRESIRWLVALPLFALALPLRGEGPAASDVKAPAAPEAKASALKVDLKIGRGVTDREPTEVADSFPADVTELVGWTKIQGAAEPTEITHVWMYNGKEVKSVPLQVKSASYRTWTKKSIAGQSGRWTLVVKDASGRTMASKDVEVASAK